MYKILTTFRISATSISWVYALYTAYLYFANNKQMNVINTNEITQMIDSNNWQRNLTMFDQLFLCLSVHVIKSNVSETGKLSTGYIHTDSSDIFACIYYCECSISDKSAIRITAILSSMRRKQLVNLKMRIVFFYSNAIPFSTKIKTPK